jgi:molybdenum cofactor biosynthesis protein B
MLGTVTSAVAGIGQNSSNDTKIFANSGHFIGHLSMLEKTKSSTQQHREQAPTRLNYAVVTVSDTRTIENDFSGQLLQDRMQAANHQLLDRKIVPDQSEKIAEAVRELTRLEQLDVILMTGGTGLSPRDCTPEAVQPLFDADIPGFGELFRWLSYQEIGAAAMLSRAIAGRRGKVLIFCLPGSVNAVRLAVEKLLVPELPHMVHHSRPS